MLKEKKLLENNIIDYYKFDGYYDLLYYTIYDTDRNNQISDEDYFFTEFRSYTSDSDYHSYSVEYNFNGVYLAFNLNVIDTIKYFGYDLSNELFDNDELLKGINDILKRDKLISDSNNVEIDEKGYLKVIL